MSYSPLSGSQVSQDDVSASTALQSKRKSGGNRMPRMLPDGSELVWPEELEAALFEALAIYPPVISRRGVTIYSDSGDPIELGHNIGRCQLIQEYIQKKTGKTRSRKQVASRLQRLRQTYKDDPRMMALLRSARKSPGEDADRPSSAPPVETQSAHQSENKAAAPYRAGLPVKMGTLLAELNGSDSDGALEAGVSLSCQLKAPDWDGPLGIANTENIAPAISSAPWAAWPQSQPQLSNSMSRRRLASNIPALRVQVDLPPPSAFIPQLPSSDMFMQGANLSSNHAQLCINSAQVSHPVTPLDQIFHTPDQPPELRRPQRRQNSFPEYSRNGTPQEAAHPLGQYGPPSPWSSVSSLNSAQSYTHSTAEGNASIYSGYRQQFPHIVSNFSSPYSSPYPSPTLQTFPRSHTRINFEDPLHQMVSADAPASHVPQIARNRSFQLPARHPATYPANHSVVAQTSYSHAPSPLSSTHSIELSSQCEPTSQSLEMLPAMQTLQLPSAHVFDGSVARMLEDFELASPIAVRPFFFPDILDSERTSPDALTSGSVSASSAAPGAPVSAANTPPQIRPPVLLESVKTEDEVCFPEWPAAAAADL